MQKKSTGTDAIVWSQPNCPQCRQAKSFLDMRGYSIEERVVGNGWTIEQLRAEFPEAKTVPQITLQGENIGTFTNLREFFDQI